MRRVCDELLAGVVELRELDAHAVERARELADLVVPVVDDRRAEVPARDALRSGLQPQSRWASMPAAVSPRMSASTRANAVAREALANDLTVASESASATWKADRLRPAGMATSA